MWTKEFWKATVERMIRLAAGSMVSVLVVGDGVLDSFDADWENTLSIGLGGAVMALLFSLMGNGISGNGPSFTKNEVTPLVTPTGDVRLPPNV